MDSSKLSVTYSIRPDATPETELAILAAVYKLCLESHAKQGAAPESRPDDGTKVKEDSANGHIIPFQT